MNVATGIGAMVAAVSSVPATGGASAVIAGNLVIAGITTFALGWGDIARGLVGGGSIIPELGEGIKNLGPLYQRGATDLDIY